MNHEPLNSSSQMILQDLQKKSSKIFLKIFLPLPVIFCRKGTVPTSAKESCEELHPEETRALELKIDKNP